MRIIAGRWRGRRLTAPPGLGTRPTTDRVREALFSMLAPRLAGAVVIDLCCGSGALGLEALSRGAARAIFVDRDAAALTALRRNLEALGAEHGAFAVHRAEATPWLRRELTREGGGLILLTDPPYDSDVAAETAVLLAERGERVELAVLECGRGSVPDAPAGWNVRTRRYGRTELLILERDT